MAKRTTRGTMAPPRWLRVVLLLSVPLVSSFVLSPASIRFGRTAASPSRRSLSSNDASEDRRRSRLSGNQRPPTPQELQVMDEMINKLADAKPYELPPAVQRAFRVISSPQFFLRIANRVDMATDPSEREKLQALASNLVSTLDAVVSTTQDRLEERSQQLQTIIAAAAEEESGEFLVPLTTERRAAMRHAMQRLDTADLDQGFLSTVDSWMNKSHQDGLDGMVVILQEALQMYAGLVLRRMREDQSPDPARKDASTVVDTLLDTDADRWETVMRDHKDHIDAVIAEVQRTMETTVLNLEAGSMMQQVLAEYLKEMVTRAEAVQKEG